LADSEILVFCRFSFIENIQMTKHVSGPQKRSGQSR
jgi:hypothetical protein